MLLRWLATLQCQFHSTEYRTFIVVQYKGQNFHHVTVTAGALQQDGLKLLERGWQFSKWRTIAQRPRFLLKHRQVMVLVVLCVATPSVATAKQSWMLGNVLAFGSHHQLVCINPKADGPVGVTGRNAVAIALVVNKAG